MWEYYHRAGYDERRYLRRFLLQEVNISKKKWNYFEIQIQFANGKTYILLFNCYFFYSQAVLIAKLCQARTSGLAELSLNFILHTRPPPANPPTRTSKILVSNQAKPNCNLSKFTDRFSLIKNVKFTCPGGCWAAGGSWAGV